MGEADLVRASTEHGFRLNESRAYAALVASGPSTGDEVGQKARIPRSAVCGALRRLVAAGAARSIDRLAKDAEPVFGRRAGPAKERGAAKGRARLG